MFEDVRGGSRASCRGEMAKDLLQKTSAEIIERVRDIDKNERQHGQTSGRQEDEIHNDMNAYFVPYRYSLLSRDLVLQVVPECQSNPHFQVTKSANILSIDEQLELEKSKEAQSHKPAVASTAQRGGNKGKSDESTPPDPSKHQYPPGFRPSKLATPKSRAGTSSLFMPSKKPSAMMASNRPGVPGAKPVKAALHMRRKGGAQALLSKGGLKQRVAGKMGAAAAATSSLAARKLGAGGTGGLVGAAGAGRASKSFGNNQRSKMKMIDVNEVDTLTKEHQARDDKIAQAQKMKSRKRKILDKAAENGLVSGKASKQQKSETSSGDGEAEGSTDNAPQDEAAKVAVNGAAAVKSEDQAEDGDQWVEDTHPPQQQSQFPPHPQLAAAMDSIAAMTAGAAAPTEPPTSMLTDPQQQDDGKQQEWKVILRERSNKLSAEDKFRVQQFFENNYNPTPDQLVYKMKLHEARTADPQSGQAIKETYYLELDYRTFTSTQSKKVKRY